MEPATPPAAATAWPPDPPAYVYAASDIRPRQAREIELCAQASTFDWKYTGAMAAGFGTSLYFNITSFKNATTHGVHMVGPGLVGFFWGGLLSGAYLSLPKCDPLWAQGPPPEGDVRASWPVATTISLLSMATAPIMDYAFLGPVKTQWPVTERSGRVFVAMGAGLVGSLFPYLLPPRTWRAKKEIEKLRVTPVAGGGGFVGYETSF